MNSIQLNAEIVSCDAKDSIKFLFFIILFYYIIIIFIYFTSFFFFFFLLLSLLLSLNLMAIPLLIYFIIYGFFLSFSIK